MEMRDRAGMPAYRAFMERNITSSSTRGRLTNPGGDADSIACKECQTCWLARRSVRSIEVDGGVDTLPPCAGCITV